MSPSFRIFVHIVLVTLPGFASAFAEAAEPGDPCDVRSGYDLTLGATALRFERVTGAEQRIEMRGGQLSVNGAPVALPANDRTRIASYESTVRALIPRIKALFQRAVDLGAAAVREEAASVSPKSATDPRLSARVDARARDLKTRIANSATTREWRGTALNRYSAEIASDVLPLVAGDLAQQALAIAMKGDVAGAAALQRRAAGLHRSLEARIRDRLHILEPEFARLCASARELDALESALTSRLPDGTRLDLIQIRG